MDMNIYSASLIITISLLIAETFLCFLAIRKRRKDVAQDTCTKTDKDYIHGVISEFSGLMSAPLTLIDGHCQMISDNSHAKAEDDTDVRGIMQNIALLRTLISSIQGLCQDYTESEITDVSGIATVMLESGQRTASACGCQMETEIQDGLMWVLDKNTLEIALHILVRTLCDITEKGKTFHIKIYEDSGRLVLHGKNSGSADRSKAENNIRILEKLISDNGGDLSFSDPGSGIFECEIRFSGTASETAHQEAAGIYEMPVKRAAMAAAATSEVFDSRKKTILILDSGKEIISLISSSLSREYNIMSPKGAEEALHAIEMTLPDMVICEADGCGNDGKRLLHNIKGGKMTMQIPVVIIATGGRIDEEDMGKADLCLSVPLNIKKMRILLKQILNRNEVLKDYYSSPISNYSIANGRIIHLEDKKFLDRIYSIISDNISSSDLSPEFIAAEMSMSIRNLYRKFSSLSSEKLSYVIKDYRISYAASLLSSSRFTVDEIIFKAGFINRGTFFRLFREKYGMTPKQYMTRNQNSVEAVPHLVESNCA